MSFDHLFVLKPMVLGMAQAAPMFDNKRRVMQLGWLESCWLMFDRKIWINYMCFAFGTYRNMGLVETTGKKSSVSSWTVRGDFATPIHPVGESQKSPSIVCRVKSMMIQDLNFSFVFSEQGPKYCWSNHTYVGQIQCFAGHKSHVLVVTSHSLLLRS